MVARNSALGFLIGAACISGPAILEPAYAAEQGGASSQPEIAGENPAGLDEIVVTAQRRAENLQKVPISISAFGADTLNQNNISSGLDLGKVVPSLKINTDSSTVTTFLRGVGSSVAAVGNEASVPVYIDGVYFSRVQPVLLRLNNITRVEVLKGPQGTLFGRNASGGLVHVITRDPQPGQKLELNGRFAYESYETVDASASMATGLGESVAIDISGLYRDQSDGWGTNFATGGDWSKEKQWLARGKLVANLTSTTTLKLEADYSRGRTDIASPSHYFDHRQGYADGSIMPLPLIGLRDAQSDGPSFQIDRVYGGSATIEQDLGFATLIDTLAIRKNRQEYYLDLDASPLPANNVLLDGYGNDTINELRLVSNGGGKLSWTAGLFYMHQVQGYDPAVFSGFVYGPLVGAGNGYGIRAKQTIKSYAGYAQGAYELTDSLKLTLGLRYTVDKVRAEGDQRVFVPSVTEIVIPGSAGVDRTQFEKLTWRSALDYEVAPNILLFASASRGFKGGGYALLPFTAGSQPARPEVLDAYEAGFKSELLDRRLRLNVAAFWYDIKDPQVFTTPSPGVTVVTNAEKARSRGIDIDGEAFLSDRLSVTFSASHLDSKYLKYVAAPFYYPNPNPPFGNSAVVAGLANGNRLTRAPEFSGNLGLAYNLPLSNDGSIRITTNVSWTDKFYWDPDNRNVQPNYALVDAQIAYTFPGEMATLSVFGRNLTDKFYYTNAYELGGPTGDWGGAGAPRVIGAALALKY
ncbi:TonB-dependent receptor [Sphingosinicella xenopeptidilytica]|uniref:TonB-dependent receptor n=1 Tax=Sphingosinicella xenopeptidilytica TaxID=364098 RepID=A0ABW3C0R6_SPHXN